MFSPSSHTPTSGLVLIGTGPSALLLAGELVRGGVDVTLVGPDSAAGFAPTYAMYADEVEGTVLEDAVLARWDAVELHTREGVRRLAEPYVRLDSRRAAAHLYKACASCDFITARVTGVSWGDDAFVVSLDTGAQLTAHRVVDASGHRPVSVRRAAGQLHQVALGGTLAGQHGLTTPVLMDFRGSSSDATFLYALPITPEQLFVEETVLLTAEAPSWSALERGLRRRLQSMGLTGELSIEEHCTIAMDAGLPDLAQPVVGFGAAASLVHPATGYQLAASARLAPPLAAALIDSWNLPISEAAARCWQVLWPSRRRRVRELQLFGARFLATLDRSEQSAFFDAFFSLPPALARAYLSSDPTVAQVSSAMWRVFVQLPADLRWRLARRGAVHPMPIIRPLFGV
jgi:lycopene beta-cyclase